MGIEIVRDVLLWCTVINYGVLLWCFLIFNLAHDWMYRFHGPMWQARHNPEQDKGPVVTSYVVRGRALVVSPAPDGCQSPKKGETQKYFDR